ncbi:hypothetical protein PHYBLDRAFT_60426 [Phycomyces blakesleeanus NRRL 1555(-)]|uniref:Uncharacterized protein n=1 Tax=Phycomyces blakesleeanus (strain ATCC 8743b / DSM 1359 / FGSC 10004 / NBRC 33097 / NRRL 1555) TaxID=763407 RepID=A0A162PZ03_PHYB8|nr:hypothetical protein PHYBLDRAFT_60426 [Phycomyces blakesleeanus NRRL 1555(-)]OAD77297.1 hypothetical protein PHYBLDRAFT_60426 [Phycomyces blakesleeanus NRRL 1555(-)]|eukprot:XP_018295337.1 hypothetical protein PHYBLDRAFT_60426 [Phycomyces blakesleeanus NRRL 1555(-)]
MTGGIYMAHNQLCDYTTVSKKIIAKESGLVRRYNGSSASGHAGVKKTSTPRMLSTEDMTSSEERLVFERQISWGVYGASHNAVAAPVIPSESVYKWFVDLSSNVASIWIPHLVKDMVKVVSLWLGLSHQSCWVHVWRGKKDNCINVILEFITEYWISGKLRVGAPQPQPLSCFVVGHELKSIHYQAIIR